MPADANPPVPKVFKDPIFAEDPTLKFSQDPDEAAQIQDLNQGKVVKIPKSRAEMFSLADAYGSRGKQIVQNIEEDNKSIIFHVLGDSGASSEGNHANQVRVADQLTLDARSSPEGAGPAFLYHLGDVVYYFGESRLYFDQFYEPFRNYPAPIFAIPGNHDSFARPGAPPDQTGLATFQRNFCSEQRVITPEALPLSRTAMTQPGVYFTLDSPFVRIIGLFSNALGDPGVISNEDGQWPSVSNDQIDFLRAQLERISQDKYQGAVLLAMHHPPFTYQPKPEDGKGGNHAPSPKMLGEIDKVCKKVGVYPHAILSGHNHNYQRYTRFINFNDKEIAVPFIVCGNGGHAVNKLLGSNSKAKAPDPGAPVPHLDTQPVLPVNRLVIAKYDDENYGYLRIYVDKDYLKIGYHQASQSLALSRYDMVTVKLSEHRLVAN